MSARKIDSPADMARQWEEYKNYCDNYSDTRTEFSQKESRFVAEKVKKKITYTNPPEE